MPGPIHLWVRAEERPNEARVGITPDGVAALLRAGIAVTVEDSAARAIPNESYRATGAEIAAAGSWRHAPAQTIVLGLKELAPERTPLHHRHIMFGHAFKGQKEGLRLLDRFASGGGTLYDLEYLVDETGRRVAAFGYWAGYAGAALSLMAWSAQGGHQPLGSVDTFPSANAMLRDVKSRLAARAALPSALIIGALGRVGTGATDLCIEAGVQPTRWDLAETAHGGPFTEVLTHDVFLNCILAMPGVPVFVPRTALDTARRLSVIGDIACDPTSDFSPIKVYDAVTDWTHPTRRVHGAPPLDVMAIDNLPALLPRESSEDFAGQLLPSLLRLGDMETGANGVWSRAETVFRAHTRRL